MWIDDSIPMKSIIPSDAQLSLTNDFTSGSAIAKSSNAQQLHKVCDFVEAPDTTHVQLIQPGDYFKVTYDAVTTTPCQPFTYSATLQGENQMPEWATHDQV